MKYRILSVIKETVLIIYKYHLIPICLIVGVHFAVHIGGIEAVIAFVVSMLLIVLYWIEIFLRDLLSAMTDYFAAKQLFFNNRIEVLKVTMQAQKELHAIVEETEESTEKKAALSLLNKTYKRIEEIKSKEN